MYLSPYFLFCFFFNDPATTQIYTLSLHDALPISGRRSSPGVPSRPASSTTFSPPLSRSRRSPRAMPCPSTRSEEHTSELQSLTNLVCRLLLEKKKKKYKNRTKPQQYTRTPTQSSQ